MNAGSTVKKTIKSTDIGEIIGYKLVLSSVGRWKPTFITINNISNKKLMSFNLRNVVLVFPGPQSIYAEIVNVKKEFTLPGTDNPNDNEQENNDSDQNDISDAPDLNDSSDPADSLNKDPTITLDINNPEGGLLDPMDKRNIIELTCEQILINPDSSTNFFGPDLPTTKANYLNILAKCHNICYKSLSPVFV